MIGAAKRKSLSPAGLTALRVLLLLVVTLCLGETRVWGFGITSQPASGVFESANPSSIGENTIGSGYDASDSPHAARGVAPEIRALSEANLTGSGRTVLGHYPEYIQKAQRTGASYFDIGDAWNTLTPAQRTSANMHFLDEVAGAGDQIYLSLPKSEIRRGSALADEIQYLTGEKGYQWINQWSLRPSGN